MTSLAKRPIYLAALFFLILMGGITSCEKPERDIGLDLQPDESILGVGTIDTFTVVAYTLPEDSIRSDKVTPALFGAYTDPVFGFAKAGHVSELRLSSSNPVFVSAGTVSTDIQVDSVVLILAYNYTEALNTNSSHYGNLGAQYIQVFEISDSLSPDSSYYHTRIPRITGEDVVESGNNLITPSPGDSIVVGGKLSEPQIRIKLKPSFVERFFLNTIPGEPISPTEFVSLLKGVYVTVDETQFNTNKSGIVYFDTFNDRSKITLYYRNTQLQDTVEYSFNFRGATGKYNTFKQDHSLSELSLYQQVIENNKAAGLQDLYIQAMGGTKIRIELPHIHNLQNIDNISVNQAAIFLPVRALSTKTFKPPIGLFILALDEVGNAFLIDDQLDGSVFVDGVYDEDKQAYRFTVSRFLQQVVLGNREFHGFEIVTSRAAFSANRVVLNGPQYPDPLLPEKNLKLAITLTKF